MPKEKPTAMRVPDGAVAEIAEDGVRVLSQEEASKVVFPKGELPATYIVNGARVDPNGNAI